MRTPLREGEVAEMATGGEEEGGGKGQSTQPEMKDEVWILANTQLVASLTSSRSAVLLFSRAVNKKTEQKDCYFCQGEKK